MQTLIYVWVCDDVEAHHRQSLSLCVESCTNDAHSLMLQTLFGQFLARKFGVQKHLEDRISSRIFLFRPLLQKLFDTVVQPLEMYQLGFPTSRASTYMTRLDDRL